MHKQLNGLVEEFLSPTDRIYGRKNRLLLMEVYLWWLLRLQCPDTRRTADEASSKNKAKDEEFKFYNKC
jgi:hypothetical protein